MEAISIDRALETVRGSTTSTREYLADSGWLQDIDLDDVEAIEADFEARYDGALSRARELLGKPAYDDRSARATVDEWYPEAIRFTAWFHRDGFVFLALEHHDRETPIGLLVGSITQREIERLLA